MESQEDGLTELERAAESISLKAQAVFYAVGNIQAVRAMKESVTAKELERYEVVIAV